MKTFKTLMNYTIVTKFFYSEILDIKNLNDVSFIRRIVNWFHIPSAIFHELSHGIMCTLFFVPFDGFEFFFKPRHIYKMDESVLDMIGFDDVEKKDYDERNKEQEDGFEEYRKFNYVYIHAFTLVTSGYRSIFSAFFISMSPLFFVLLNVFLSFYFTPFIYITAYLLLTFKTTFPSKLDLNVLNKFFSIYIVAYLVMAFKTFFASKKNIRKYCIMFF